MSAHSSLHPHLPALHLPNPSQWTTAQQELAGQLLILAILLMLLAWG